MNIVFRKSVIFGTASLVLLSALMCCCLTSLAQAEEVPSCHQTAQEAESSHNTDECGCDQSFTIIKKEVVRSNPLVKVMTLGVDQKPTNQTYFSPIVVAYHSSPQFYDMAPLYSQYSNLRI